MLLTAIWNVLSKLEPYSAKGYLEDKLTEHSVVISKAQGLELLRKRGYIFKDELSSASGWVFALYYFCRSACGSVFAKGKKDKAEAEETVVEKPAPQVSPYNEDIAK